ncbi:MAG: CPBP family intramembrane glutamic endopeptidase [Saccharofermentanales bacterium]|nr:CPBP family intramembrane metalloprotease [Clostridiaceae bacterium]
MIETNATVQNPNQPLRRLSWRTVVVPLAFLAIHFVLSNLVAFAYMAILAVVQAIQNSVSMSDFFENPEVLDQLLGSHILIITTISGAVIIPICLVYLHQARRRDRRAYLTEKVKPAQVLASVAAMIGSLGLINLWIGLLTALQEQIPMIRDWMNEYLDSINAVSTEGSYFWLIFGICLVTPIVEELIFRGVIQGELRKAMPEWAAIIIQAVIFAAYHFQPIQSSYVLLPGLLLGFAYAVSRSIRVPVIMHCVFNFLGGVLPALLENNEAALHGLAIAQFGFILVGAAAFAYLFLNRREPAAYYQTSQNERS